MASLFATIVFVLLFIFLSFSSHGEAAPTYSSHYCDNITSFMPNSTYRANIRTLLSSLSSHTNSSTNGFYNTTAGRDPDLVYGTFLCRGDVSADLCRKCVEIASNDIARRCVTEKLGVIWYDECTLRYSDQNIFSIIREVPGIDISSSKSIQGDKDGFNQLLSSVMNSLMNRVAYDDQSGKRFATGEANFTRLQTLYSLVQCTPDLTDALCFRCLQSAIASIPMCCDGKQGGRVLLPSCNIRYDTSPFYRLNGTAAVVLPSPSPPNSTTQEGAEDLISYSWKLWRDGTPLEMMDANIRTNYSRNEVSRCIHVGLLCVQEDPTKRPMMTTVVPMLESYSVSLPQPQSPASFLCRGNELSPQGGKGLGELSNNEVSITELEPR
ncbi:hypothetical protein V6N12_065853 [Hibiscus sabdariffa]|uniref:Gnk2-homologous domain-containing protein n=1 Tax=Hibiscus sabdariffa TaxID=183260 RepID=A0ABR2ABP2_9ROSI